MFRDNLKKARQQRKLSGDKAAELCGVSRSTWFAYEAGTSEPTLAGLREIAAALGTTPSALLKGDTQQ